MIRYETFFLFLNDSIFAQSFICVIEQECIILLFAVDIFLCNWLQSFKMFLCNQWAHDFVINKCERNSWIFYSVLFCPGSLRVLFHFYGWLLLAIRSALGLFFVLVHICSFHALMFSLWNVDKKLTSLFVVLTRMRTYKEILENGNPLNGCFERRRKQIN